MGLERHRFCFPLVFLNQSQCKQSTLRVNHSSVLIYIRVLLHQNFFFRLRHQPNQVSNLRQVENQQPWADLGRYRKTVSSALWLQLAMLFCYLPHLLLTLITFRKSENNPLSVFAIPVGTTITLMLFNSTLNPILYCWRIKEVRRAVTDLLPCSREWFFFCYLDSNWYYS